MAKAKKSRDTVPEKLDDETKALDISEAGMEPARSPSDEENTTERDLSEDKSDLSVKDVTENTAAPDAVEETPEPLETVPEDRLETENDKAARHEEVVDESTEAPKEEAHEPVEEKLPVPVMPVQQKSSIWPAVFGGVIAAMIGFIAGRGDQLDAYLPASMQREAADLSPLVAQTTALSDRIDALETAAPESPDLSNLASTDALQSAMAEVETLQATVLALTERLGAVESRPAETIETIETVIQQPAGNTEEIESLQAAVDALQAQVQADEVRAKSEAERILAQAALTRVMTAVENGETFAPALSALEEATPVEVPEALRAAAAEGVPSLSMLRENFPDAARAGLSASRAQVPETDVTGIGGFLRRQLSARSLAPREGDDPDAVLSRAEAAVKAGNLDEAMKELDALPDVAKSAMQGWIDGATARQNVRNAADDLADSLTVN